MMSPKPFDSKHLFGPVPSRRLGMSLGVDLMPHKTCNLDCIYCECGATTHLTLARKDYVSPEQIKAELSAVLCEAPLLDYITFSGHGEPTLHKSIGDIIGFLHRMYPKYRVAVLTNGTLFYRKEVREQLYDVDVLKVSIDGVSDTVFNRVNRPCPGLRIDQIIDGLITFRKHFSKQFWIEVFLVPELNDTQNELEKLKNIIELLNPHKIQINTLDRPGTEKSVVSAEKEKLQQVAAFLFDAEIIKPVDEEKTDRVIPDNENKPVSSAHISARLLATIKRRPCTVDDLSRLLGLTRDEVKYYIDIIMKTGKIVQKQMPRGVFYKVRL